MSARLTILAPTRYPWRFNSPKSSRHNIIRRKFVPFNYLSPRLEGVTLFPPTLSRRIDLIHGFNRIPLNSGPFIMGFESHLPRGFGIEDSRFFSFMRRQLADDRCRSLIAISNYARRTFLQQHEGTPEQAALEKKLIVRLPSMVLSGKPSRQKAELGPIRLFFVGNHFARKGGCVALRVAEKALAAKLPINLEIVSKLEVGGVSWTDPLDTSFFDPYRPLLDLPNVKLWGELPNDQVIAKIQEAHFLMLPTFGDTFGYSAIEALANATPVIATNQCALPEFITDGDNGFLLDLPLNDKDEWVFLSSTKRGTRRFERDHAEEVDRLAEDILQRLERVLNRPASFATMAARAYETAVEHFDARKHDSFWDDLYEASVATRPHAVSHSVHKSNLRH